MKKNLYIKQFISIMIIASILLLLLFDYYSAEVPKAQSPKSVKGQLDLSAWDLSNGKTAFLNGEWSFYPGQLLKPEELSEEPSHMIKVPGGWRNRDEEYTQTAKGNGTYRLMVKLPELHEPLALKIQNIWMAHRLFINGKLVKESGMPANSLEGYRPENTPYIVSFEPEEELEIVIQVSNQIFYTGGISQPVQIGIRHVVEMKDKLSFGGDMASFFLFLIFGIYHLHMYQMRDKELTYLYSGLFLIARSFTIAAMGEKILMQLVSGLPFEAAYKLLEFALCLSIVFLALFIQVLEPKAMKKKILNLLLLPVFVYLGLVLFTPYHFFTEFKEEISFYADAVMILYALRFISILLLKKERQLPVNESAYVALCIIFVGINIFDTLLFYTGYTSGSLISKLSMLGFLLCMNLFLARRFTNKMNEVQALSVKLVKANEIKDEFLARTSHELKTPLYGIVNISSHLLKEG